MPGWTEFKISSAEKGKNGGKMIPALTHKNETSEASCHDDE